MNIKSMLAADILASYASGSIAYGDAYGEFIRRGQSSPKAERRARKNLERLSKASSQLATALADAHDRFDAADLAAVVDDKLESYGVQTDTEAWQEVLTQSGNRWEAYATLRQQGWNAPRIAAAAGVKPASVRNVWNNPAKGIKPVMPQLG